MSTRLLLSALALLAISARAAAQEAAPAAPVEAAAPAVTVAGANPETSPTATRDKDTLSVDFPDEDIKTILRNVADLFELNLVVPDTLTGKTSIKLRDVTWRQIFQVVLTPAGYTYIEEGNIIKIVSNEALTQEPTSTEVFILNNAKAADIKPTIEGLVDAAAGGKILIDARSNALVITERPSRMGRMRVIIEQLDKATDQVMIESKFVEVTDRDVRDIGVNWASLQGMQFGVGNINQTFSRGRDQTRTDGINGSTQNGTNTSNSSNTTGTNSSGLNTTGGDTTTYVTGISPVGTGIASTTSLPSGAVSGLPASIPTVTTQANFVPATGTTPATATALTTYNGTSTATTGNNTSTTTVGSTGSNASNLVNNLIGLTNTGTTNRLASAVFSASDFNVIVSALKTQNNAKVVSNPTVVTLNNTEAVLNIGSEFPIPSYTYNSERGTFEVSGFQYKPIGVILKVTPQVNARGVVKLTLEPEISQQADSTSFGGAGGASIPIISTRKVKTQVSLASGQTVGIGGLISTTKSRGGTKVPLLGDIPGLGKLFSSKSINDNETNLLIFVTAKVISAEGATPEDVFQASALEAVQVVDSALAGGKTEKKSK